MIGFLEALRDFADLGGDFEGDLLGGFGGFEGFGADEDAAELVDAGAIGDFVEGDFVSFVGGVGEVGVDFDAFDVGDDQERRIVEGFAVALELGVGFCEVFVFAFALVFPAEFAVPPDVGEALCSRAACPTAANREIGVPRGVPDGDAFFEGVLCAGGIVFCRCGLAEEAAEVEEMFLGGGAFRELSALPFGDEGSGSEGVGRCGCLGVVEALCGSAVGVTSDRLVVDC